MRAGKSRTQSDAKSGPGPVLAEPSALAKLSMDEISVKGKLQAVLRQQNRAGSDLNEVLEDLYALNPELLGRNCDLGILNLGILVSERDGNFAAIDSLRHLKDALHVIRYYAQEKIQLTDHQLAWMLELCLQDSIKYRVPAIRVLGDVLQKLSENYALTQINFNKLFNIPNYGATYSHILEAASAADLYKDYKPFKAQGSTTAVLRTFPADVKSAEPKTPELGDEKIYIIEKNILAILRRNTQNFCTVSLSVPEHPEQNITLNITLADFEKLTETITLSAEDFMKIPSVDINNIFNPETHKSDKLALIHFHKALGSFSEGTMKTFEELMAAQSAPAPVPAVNRNQPGQ